MISNTMHLTAIESERYAGGNKSEPAKIKDSTADISYEKVTIGDYKAIAQGSDSARAINLNLASQSINGKVIEPGATFSFNNAIGDIEQDKRYQDAPVVNNGDVSVKRGGGICQVSSALYVAALSANMGIAERHPHSISVDYVPLGLDATVSVGELDLKIVNNSEYPITIKAVAKGQTVTVSLKGHPLKDGFSITPTSKIIGYYDADGKPKDLKTAKADKSKDTYCVVKSYRVYYQDGVKTSSELLTKDRYQVAKDNQAAATSGGVDALKN